MIAPRLCYFIVPHTTSARRLVGVPHPGEIFFDTDLGVIFYGDGKTKGGVRVPTDITEVTGVTGHIMVFGADKRPHDSGRPFSELLRAPLVSQSGNVVIFNGTNGVRLEDSGIAANRLVTGPTLSRAGNIALFSDEGGRTIRDDHWPINMFVTASTDWADRQHPYVRWSQGVDWPRHDVCP